MHILCYGDASLKDETPSKRREVLVAGWWWKSESNELMRESQMGQKILDHCGNEEGIGKKKNSMVLGENQM